MVLEPLAHSNLLFVLRIPSLDSLHSSSSVGPPITISWEYNPNTLTLSVEEYEKSRPVRRTQSEMILPRSIRMEMLRKEWGISQHQIADSVRNGVKAKHQRRTTVGNLGKTERVEEMIEGATKQLLKVLFLRKSSSKKAKELGDKIQYVNNQRAKMAWNSVMKGEYECDDSESMSPWLTELAPDESEELGLDESTSEARDIMPPPPPPEAKEHCPENSREWSTGKGMKDDKPKIPMRDDSSADMSNSWSEDDGPIRSPVRQSSGESASQRQRAYATTRSRPFIVAEEPEEDLLPGLTAAVHVDC